MRLFTAPDRLHGTPGLFTYRRCISCRAVFQDPRVIADDLSLCYSHNYFTHRHQPSFDPNPIDALLAKSEESSSWRAVRERLRRAIIARVRNEPMSGFWVSIAWALAKSRRLREKAFFDRAPDDLLMRTPETPRALDVGCGAGQNLIVLGRVGWEVEGVEWDADAAEIARIASGRPVSVGDFRKVDLPANSYGLILLHHVFEHIDDPVGALHRINELLAAGGRVVLAYPNPESLGARLFSDRWFPWEVPRHLVIPPVHSLLRVANQIGLATVSWRTETKEAGRFFAFSRYYRAGRQVDEEHPNVNRWDRWLQRLERCLVGVGMSLGEEVRVVLQKERT